MPDARLISIQVAEPRIWGDDTADDPMDRSWSTGFFKEPVAGPVEVSEHNLDGDRQADRENHGGADKAICAYATSHYPAWQERLGRPDLPWGAFGENFSLSELVESEVCVGDIWSVGPQVVVQVSQPRQPCWKLARRWREKTLAAEVIATGRTGWYFRVLQTGSVSAGDRLALVERPQPEWTIMECNRVMHHEKKDRELAARLAAVPELSASWRQTLLNRAAG